MQRHRRKPRPRLEERVLGRDQVSGRSVLERGCKGKLPTGRGRPTLPKWPEEAGEAEGLPGSQVDKTWQECPNRWGRLEEEDRGLRLGCLCYQSQKRQTGDTHRGEISYNRQSFCQAPGQTAGLQRRGERQGQVPIPGPGSLEGKAGVKDSTAKEEETVPGLR